MKSRNIYMRDLVFSLAALCISCYSPTQLLRVDTSSTTCPPQQSDAEPSFFFASLRAVAGDAKGDGSRDDLLQVDECVSE